MTYPVLGQPLPRAAEAHSTEDKWDGWILAVPGHGAEWARVFAVTTGDRELIWSAITQALTDAPISTIRDRTPYGVVAGVELTLKIRGRTARIMTSWHYVDEDAVPRLATAYPTL